LGQASWWDSGANAVDECQFDIVPAEGGPQGKGRDGEEPLEVISKKREHRGHERGNRHVSRQRAAKWLFDSGPTAAGLHAA